MNPIGGYFSLELNEGKELHSQALRLNAGRYALEYILKVRSYRKVFVPYYICESILQPIKRMGVEYEFYHINEQFEPAVELQPQDGEAVLYVNYFGLKNRFASSFCKTYPNTILDQTQAFFSEPGSKNEDNTVRCDTFYSCRKFFGIPDGAYLYIDDKLNEELPYDESFDRMSFLTKRIDRSPQEGYADFHANDKSLSFVGMKRMSKLTEAMMRGIDYSTKANKRIHNFQVLDKALRASNRFKWGIDDGAVPLVYPYYIKNGAKLRQKLIDNQVFCARYWPNVMDWCEKSDWEYELVENLVCLPIDQRYGEEDMNQVLAIISM